MPLKLWLKLTLLTISLSATLIGMYWLKQGHMSSFWTSLGFHNQNQRINWCSERVGAIFLYDNKAKLYEEAGKWLWQQSNLNTPLDYLRVEKWFAQYCQVDIDKLENVEAESPIAVFEAQFIDGDRLTLYSYPNGDFKMRDQVFKSETLRQALKELLAFANKME